MAILGLLGIDRWTPYELVQHMKRSTIHYIWPRAESKMYEELKRLAAAGYGFPDSPREGRDGPYQSLQAAGAHEERLGIDRDGGDGDLAGSALDQTLLAEDVALAQLGDDPSIDADRQMSGEQDVETVHLVGPDRDGLAVPEGLDRAEDRQARELACAHALDDTVPA